MIRRCDCLRTKQAATAIEAISLTGNGEELCTLRYCFASPGWRNNCHSERSEESVHL